MAQRELRLVVDIALGRAFAAFVIVAVDGVVAVGAFVTHVIAHALPSFHGETAVKVVALVVGLGGAHAGEGDFMLFVDALRHVEEPVVAAVGCALDVAVAPAVCAEHGNGPAVLHHACGEFEAVLVHAVVAHAVPKAAATVDVEGARCDCDGAADRGRGKNGCAEAALCLDVGCDVAEAGPVAPVYVAVLHVVDRNAVHCHGHPLALEAAHAGFGIAVAAALLVGVHAGSGLKDFGEFLLSELEVDSGLVHIAHGHGGDACLTDGLGHDDVVEQGVVGFEFDYAEVFCYFALCAFETDVADFDVLGVVRDAEGEVTVNVGDCCGIASRHRY